MTKVIYHPKGGMCKVCYRHNNDCSDYDFSKMRVIDYYPIDGGTTKIVVCSFFIHKKEFNTGLG